MSERGAGRLTPAARAADPQQCVIRAAADADRDAIAGIYAAHVASGTGSFEEHPPSAAEMAARMQQMLARDLPYLVACRGAAVCGFAYAAPFRPRSAYRYTVEDSVYVSREMTGRGIGRLLLGELIRECSARGFRQMVAVIGDSANHPSIRLHRALGFQDAGALSAVGYKFDRWLDVVFMQRPLDGATAAGLAGG